MASSNDLILKVFPNLAKCNWKPTSPNTPQYNCIAFAAGDSSRFWWPGPYDGYWPKDVPRETTLEAFQQAFEKLGYSACDDDSQEVGYEKVAIFAQGGKPTHAARMGTSGTWMSKLGQGIDIEHELHGVEGDLYGKVALLLRRTFSQ